MDRTLVRNSIVIADPKNGESERVSILLEGATIAALGDEADAASDKADTVLDMQGRIAIPGFVNAHMHSWQTALRGIAMDWKLMEYLGNMHGRVMPAMKPEDVYIGTLAAALGQLHCGVTTLGDWCHANLTPDHTDAGLRALGEVGIRAVFMHAVPMGQGHARDRVTELMEHAAFQTSGLLSLGLAISGPLYSAPNIAEADLALARDLGLPVSMHHSGPPAVPDEVWYDLIEKGLFGPGVNIVHANHMSDDLMQRLVDTGTTFTMTPEVEMNDGHGHPVTGRLMKKGGRPAIGIDIECAVSPGPVTAAVVALSHQRAMDAGNEDAHPISRSDALDWITGAGAHALCKKDEIGKIAPGMQADLTFIDSRSIDLWPVNDPVATVLRSGPGHVDTVMVAGRILKREKALVGQETGALLRDLSESGCRLVADAGLSI